MKKLEGRCEDVRAVSKATEWMEEEEGMEQKQGGGGGIAEQRTLVFCTCILSIH